MNGIAPGHELPPVELDVTYSKVAAVVAATGDHFPGHHDPEFARAQGQETIYLNTMVLAGFLDRVVTDWSGPAWFIVHRRFGMTSSVYAGDRLTGSGEVLAVGDYDGSGPSVTVQVRATTRRGVACHAVVTIRPVGR